MSNNERGTFETATPEVQRLMLWDKITGLDKKYRERKRLDIYMILSIIGLAIISKMLGQLRRVV